MKASIGLLCVLGAAFVVAAAAAADGEDMSFAKWARSSSFGNKANLLNEYGPADTKHLCLKELKQYNCRSVGCPNVQDCGATDCRDCQTHQLSQSDLGCCDDKHYGEFKDSSDDIFTPALRVGTCDWDLDLYWCPTSSPTCTSDPIPMENGAFKIGTAWATCYLNADSEYCGHPFCDKMVLSFKGGAYATAAYAKGSYASDGEFCYNSTGLAKAIESTDLKQKLLAKLPSASSGDKRYGRDVNYTLGIAVLFSGPVTVTSLQHHVEYKQGMMEYVAFFAGGVTTTSPTKELIVSPYTYDLVLTSTDKNDHKDEHHKEEREPYYKEGPYDSHREYKEERHNYRPEGDRYHE